MKKEQKEWKNMGTRRGRGYVRINVHSVQSDTRQDDDSEPTGLLWMNEARSE